MNPRLFFFSLFLCFTLGSGVVLADGMPAYPDESNDHSKAHDAATTSSKDANKSIAMSDSDLLKYQYCGRDSDCMIAMNGCCQCSQGGLMTAVAKDRFEAFRSKFICEGVQCDMNELGYMCDDAVVSCINKRCTYISGSDLNENPNF